MKLKVSILILLVVAFASVTSACEPSIQFTAINQTNVDFDVYMDEVYLGSIEPLAEKTFDINIAATSEYHTVEIERDVDDTHLTVTRRYHVPDLIANDWTIQIDYFLRNVVLGFPGSSSIEGSFYFLDMGSAFTTNNQEEALAALENHFLLPTYFPEHSENNPSGFFLGCGDTGGLLSNPIYYEQLSATYVGYYQEKQYTVDVSEHSHNPHIGLYSCDDTVSRFSNIAGHEVFQCGWPDEDVWTYSFSIDTMGIFFQVRGLPENESRKILESLFD